MNVLIEKYIISYTVQFKETVRVSASTVLDEWNRNDRILKCHGRCIRQTSANSVLSFNLVRIIIAAILKEVFNIGGNNYKSKKK